MKVYNTDLRPGQDEGAIRQNAYLRQLFQREHGLFLQISC